MSFKIGIYSEKEDPKSQQNILLYIYKKGGKKQPPSLNKISMGNMPMSLTKIDREPQRILGRNKIPCQR